jgi:hypothetical protein
MNQLDPAAAEQALTAARQQRRNVVEATRVRWWAWPLGMLAIFAVVAQRDFVGSGAYGLVTLTAVVGLAVLVIVPKVWPRAAGAGVKVQPHRSVVPWWFRASSFALGITSAVLAASGGTAVAHLLEPTNPPSWIVEHPHVVAGAVMAVVLGALAWVLDRSARAWLSR